MLTLGQRDLAIPHSSKYADSQAFYEQLSDTGLGYDVTIHEFHIKVEEPEKLKLNF